MFLLNLVTNVAADSSRHGSYHQHPILMEPCTGMPLMPGISLAVLIHMQFPIRSRLDSTRHQPNISDVTS